MTATAAAHAIPSETFERLAGGAGDILGVLRDGQRSKRLLLLREVLSVARARAPRTFAQAEATAAFALLVAAERRSRRRVDSLLLEPGIGAWATACLRLLDRPDRAAPEDVGHAIGHVGALAASAALRSGLAFDVAVYRRAGSVMLPTLGMVRLAGGDGWCRLRSVPGADGVEVWFGDSSVVVPFRSSGSRRDDTWLPLRRLRSTAGGLTIAATLDDLDPFRGCGQLRTMARLDTAAVDDWQATLDAAWRLLVEDDPGAAEAISGGVSSLVPLSPTATVTELSASCHEAIGAIAVTPPRKPLSLALALVHEFQHTKLAALLDLVPLHDRSPGRLHYAPWRADPRPLHGLLHGTYAFLGLTAFWNRHRGRLAMADESAAFEFALGRGQLGTALRSLTGDPGLLPAGARFVEGMRHRLTELDGSAVSERDSSLARLARLDHAIAWRLRNVQPDREQIDRWASAWHRGTSCSWPDPVRSTVGDGGGPMPSDTRLVLFRRRAAAPAGSIGWTTEVPAASAADLQLVGGHPARALEAYSAELIGDPDNLAAWSGLALAHRQACIAGSSVLVARPEIVHAVHRAIIQRTGEKPGVEDLVRWLAEGVGDRHPRPAVSEGHGLEVEGDALPLPGIQDIEVVGRQDRLVAGDGVGR